MDGAQIIIGWRSALIFAICLPILISALILMFRVCERRANVYLALALICSVWSMGPQIIGFANGYVVWPGLTFFPFNTELLIPPFIYFHAYALMSKQPLAWRKYLLIPGVLAVMYYFGAFFLLGDYQNKWAFSRSFHSPYVSPVLLILTLVLAVICAGLTLRFIQKYRIFLQHTESTAQDFDPAWLIWMFGLLGTASFVWLSLGLLSLINPDISYVRAYPFQLVVMMIFAVLGFATISRTNDAFPKIEASKGSASEPNPTKDWASEAKTLRDAVISNEWYLEARLSVRDVAGRMGTNETYVSRTLNQGLGQSFNRFINDMRVQFAKDLIKSKDTNLLNIAMDSGFNSKATFNRVFRDIAGETPSSFKSRLSKNVS